MLLYNVIYNVFNTLVVNNVIAKLGNTIVEIKMSKIMFV